MPRMERETDLLGPMGVIASWITAAWALPFAIVLAALGQGLGAVLGSCTWIGVSLPVDRTVWALVNQPVLSFAASTSASGYWLGSLVLPAAVAALALGFVPRPRTWAAEMATVHVAWASIVVSLAWLPVLDLHEGHFVRWLRFRELPEVLVFLAPMVAAALAFLPVLRLLAVERSARRHLGRGQRILTVLIHLCLPAAAWVAVSTVVAGGIVVFALASAAIPLLIALGIAWLWYPAAVPQRLAPVGVGSIFRGVVVAIVLFSTLWLAGRPLSGGRCSGILWATPTSMNNIRSWIEPLNIRDLVSSAASDAPKDQRTGGSP